MSTKSCRNTAGNRWGAKIIAEEKSWCLSLLKHESVILFSECPSVQENCRAALLLTLADFFCEVTQYDVDSVNEHGPDGATSAPDKSHSLMPHFSNKKNLQTTTHKVCNKKELTSLYLPHCCRVRE